MKQQPTCHFSHGRNISLKEEIIKRMSHGRQVLLTAKRTDNITLPLATRLALPYMKKGCTVGRALTGHQEVCTRTLPCSPAPVSPRISHLASWASISSSVKWGNFYQLTIIAPKVKEKDSCRQLAKF